MNNFEIKIWDDEAEKCTFYTVQNENEDISETDKFFTKFNANPTYKTKTEELLVLILEIIGDKYGAIDDFFNRYENEVQGLPFQGKVILDEILFHYQNFPLRLYALRITEELVILFNGGIKDAPTNQESSLYLKWIEACNFAKKILDAIQEETILINNEERKLTDFNSSDELFL